MPELHTSRFGKIEYTEEEIIHFANGIPGFEEEKEYIFIQPDQNNPIVFLQSINAKELSFVIVNPFTFFADYEFDLDDRTKEELEIKEIEDVAVWGIISIPEDFQRATINLKAPVIINVKNKKAKQVILQQSPYQTKTTLFPQSVKEGVK